MVTTKSYDNLNRLTGVSTTNTQAAVLDSHVYAYNSANQRTAVTDSDTSYWVYQYDSLGQVTSGKKYWNDGTPVAGQQFGYGFDSIGNRQSTTAGGDQTGANLRSASYGANNLNQYTNRTVPAAVDVMGSATNAATVTINGQSTYRHSDYYRAELGVDNGSAPVFQSVSNLAVLTLDTNTVSTNIIGNVFLPQTPEGFTYDADGNLTSDGRWTYLWDGENRLIGMTNNANVPDAAKMTLSFAYDYLGRRTGKTVSKYNSSTSSYQLTSQNTFVYDGWNLQAELNTTNNAVVRSYASGLDLGGTAGGAGGVGGLLWTFQPQIGNTRAFFCFDGNGNVSSLAYCSDATIVGQYEYGPFGEVIRATGPVARANPFRFSNKYQDDETDLQYYGYRYYNARTGSWLSKDPVEEIGGFNLHGFIGNNTISRIDSVGLEDPFDVAWTSDGGSFGQAAPNEAQQKPQSWNPFLWAWWNGRGDWPINKNSDTCTCEKLKKLLQQAYVADDVYNDYAGGRVWGAPNLERLSDDQLTSLGLIPGMFASPGSGFFSALYLDHNDGSYVYATRGTEPTSLLDLLTDGFQAEGLPVGQYRSAANLGFQLGQNPKLQGRVSVVGHSLGGGLAAAASLRGLFPAVTFNAAGLSPVTASLLGISLAKADSFITEYSTPGDFLSRGLNRTPYAPSTNGHQTVLPSPQSWPLGLDRHTMANVINSIHRLMAQNGCKY